MSKKTKRFVHIRSGMWVRVRRWTACHAWAVSERSRKFLARRPHRTLRLTRRRDYARSLDLPGYVAFTGQVWRFLRMHRRTFLSLVLLYSVIMIAIGGITNQETYTQIGDLIKESGGDVFGDGMSKIGEAGLLAALTFLTGPGDLSPDQQIYLGLSLLFAWLCTVWLLREYLQNRKPRLRDGLYSSGSPVLATFLIVVILVVQLLPVGLAALMFAGLTSVGLLDGGFGSMLFWVFATVVAALVLYWITSTIIALVVVTLPGMYPLRALRISSDLVVGRRLRILYRWLWSVVVVAITWVVVMIPMILIDAAIKSAFPSLQFVPIVPYTGAIMAAATAVWTATYVYLLYRRIVDDDAKPA